MLNPTQIATLRTLVLGESSLAQARNDGNDQVITDWLNASSTPAFYVYKSVLTRHSILTETSPDGTVFGWVGALYITRNQGERDAFREMFNSTGSVNPALGTVQAAFGDIFSGAGGLANRTHILSMSRRVATRAEKQLAAGAGTAVSPATATFEGYVSTGEAGLMR